MESVFSSAEIARPFEMFSVRHEYDEDEDPRKIYLVVGAYRTEEGEPWVLPVVQKTELEMASDKSLNHEYLMYLGDDSFRQAATRLLLGDKNPAILEGRAIGIQSISGTGAIRVGAEFLRRVLKFKTVYICNPTWDNHHRIFNLTGYSSIREYRYWDAAKKGLDLAGLLDDLQQAPPRSVVMLHACAHNPTGCDPTREQWAKIADVMEERKLFPFFDAAYHGFATGDLENDAWTVRYFVERGFELFCAQSFAKNFGLYNERIGNLTIVLNDPSVITNLENHMMILIRGLYCSPPNHGMRIVERILNNPQLFQEWQENIRTMANRVLTVRKALRERLEKLSTPGSWEHITQQIGMFSFTGLTPHQVEFMVKERHIYMLKNGRINMCALNSRNLDYVAQAMHDAIVQCPT
ncbi:aspartate aminotransferase, cytoplasmic [Anabrus simplex]|uniref:aspartate aminotransferase, cytoplasmic n=1 Tax=Anabrus simplex TaxID=316456 RepID=UPI0035A3348E